MDFDLHQGTPTVRPYQAFNAEADSHCLRKAMKGFGTDEKAIIDVLAYRSLDQRIQIRNLYKTIFGRDLIHDLRSELGSHFEAIMVALLMPRDEYDASELRAAISGLGTNEDCLIEILCTRSNDEIRAIRATYKTMYRADLERDLASDTSGHFRRLMISLVNANRMEAQAVDMNKAREDAQKLYSAGVQRWGTDESAFNAILASQSYPQLRAVFQQYANISNSTLEQSIAREMSGDLCTGMIAIVKVVSDRVGYFAEKIYHSMKGAGTLDRQLIRLVVTRCEVDMVEIKQAFQSKYGKTMASFIQGDTSGDYRRVLLALVGN